MCIATLSSYLDCVEDPEVLSILPHQEKEFLLRYGCDAGRTVSLFRALCDSSLRYAALRAVP